MKGRTQIVVAFIGLLGVIGAAWITANAPLRTNAKSAQKVPSQQHYASTAAAAAADRAESGLGLAVTGVRIGQTDTGEAVEPRTSFKSGETIMVAVRYEAEERVEDFPVRLSVRLTSALIGHGDTSSTVDVGQGGKGSRTFRLKEETPWAPGPHLLTVSINGSDVYRQMIDIE